MTLSSLKMVILIAAMIVGFVVRGDARPALHQHTATQAQPMELVDAAHLVPGGFVDITTEGRTRTITSNGLPSHPVGAFPNSGNPNRISSQSYTFRTPVMPKVGVATPLGRGDLFGVAINGVPFDPDAAEFWQGDPQSGWDYNVLGGAVALGLDANYGHVQPSGAYHYHGLPVGLLQQLGWSASGASPLVGYAADGFSIYALTAETGGTVVRMTSSYLLKTGDRPGGDAPGGSYDGTFNQDFEYVPGSGALDECNGAMVITADYPGGTYAYFLTNTYPVVPRCLVGAIGRGFGKR